MELKLDKTTKILLGAIALGLFLSSCSDESEYDKLLKDLNESYPKPRNLQDVFPFGEALKECNDHLNSGAVEALTGYQKKSIVGGCLEQYGYYGY